jgi:GTP-binding protein
MSHRKPSVVLVGRPNVGKSTLFNRIAGSRRAIVAPIPGTTRDRLEREVVWGGSTFRLTDTGGLFGASEDPLQTLVVQQGRRAVEEADMLVLVTDGREGLVAGDKTIAGELHQSGRPVVVAVNKLDDKRAQGSATEFYQLGFDRVLEISAEHGTGVAELLEAVMETLRDQHLVSAEESRARDAGLLDRRAETRVAIVGRPNAGKSALVNRLLNEERMLVSELPGTTRDAVETVVTWHRRRFRIVDTAGMRRPGRVAAGGTVEMVSVGAARRAIADADVVVLVIDASVGATEQDAAIGGEADRAGRGVVIAASKWDLVKGRGADYAKTFDEEVRRRMQFLDYARILHVSAVTGERAARILQAIDAVAEARRRRIPTAALNAFVAEITAAHPPVSPGRKHVRIMYAAQIGVAPPSFVFFTNVATKFHFSYERFLVNQLRERFGFEGTPVRIHVRRRRE